MLCIGIVVLCTAIQLRAEPAENSAGWTFVSMPDFLNVDTDYPQPGWEPALDVVLTNVKRENPDFLLVAGDLLMGHWYTAEDIEKYAARYYPAWIRRLRHYDLPFYAAVGDHELGDNPWPDWKTALVPLFKEQFRNHLKMPENGPAHMRGTAFWWRHRNVLFVSVDVFEKAPGNQGGITAQVTGEQLSWLSRVLAENSDADHFVVMGHTPVLGPVRAWSSSQLMLDKGRESDFWKTLARHGVDLYLCGEVHSITCIERDGVMQIAHGGLIGYNTRTNYLVGKVTANRITLELKEIDIVPRGKKLWQPGNNRPLETINISDEVRRRGFVPVGRIVLEKGPTGKRFVGAEGYFDPKNEPAKPEFYRPYGESEPPRLPGTR
jgi:DNA repair exonuclease SbcCD nuclease subunit